jgi:hypothetical protein
MTPFGKFAPDASTLDVALAGDISGVRPGRTSYVPWPQMAVASAALPSACRGAYMGRTLSNAGAVFAGTSQRLYKFASLAAWTDFSKGATNYTVLGTDDLWQFAQYGPAVYATNIANPLQSCDVSAGTVFADVAGSPPKARYIAVVGDFLMLGNTETSSREVRWSSRNDPTTWTRYQRDADSQQFPDGGDIMGLSGWEQGGLIFQTEVVRQMGVRQDAAIMEFHRVEASQGTLAPYSIVSRQGTSYYYATNGFQRITTDGASEGIGANWLDSWFLDHSLAASRPKAIIGSFTSRTPQIMWLYASASNNGTTSIFDHMLCFDPSLTDSDYGPWTHAPVSASIIFSSGTTATTLDALGTPGLGYTIDNVPYSLDADVWKGGAPRMGAFNDAFQMNFFIGPPMAAVLQTGLFTPVPGSRAYVNGFRLVSDAAAGAGRIAVTERQQTPETWQAPGSALTSQGIIYTRASGRHMRMEVTIPAGATWTRASGISLEDDQGLVTAAGGR